MDYGNMISESIDYAKEAIWGKWGKWILLVISTIIFPLIMGYIVRIFAGEKPAPELEQWGKLFIDGLKLFIIRIIYAIPVFLVLFAFTGGSIALLASGSNAAAAALGSLLIGVGLAIVIDIIISLIGAIGAIRFARKGGMGQAFAFGAILEHIGKIGWLNYIGARIILWLVGIVFFIVIIVVSIPIPLIGWLIALFLDPVYTIFWARYMVHVYESAPAPE